MALNRTSWLLHAVGRNRIDTTIWIDHLRRSADSVRWLLEIGMVVCHPYVIGEIALGNLRDRHGTLTELENLPSLPLVDPAQVVRVIADHALHGRGLGFVDVSLLASTLSLPGTLLWTRDQRLHYAAEALGIAYAPENPGS